MESRCLLGFIISKEGICVDPLNIKSIMNLPPPCIVVQLQRLQGKASFLQCFISNYTEISKGCVRLLKKGVPFVWDDQAQFSFDSLKKYLSFTPLLTPPIIIVTFSYI